MFKSLTAAANARPARSKRAAKRERQRERSPFPVFGTEAYKQRLRCRHHGAELDWPHARYKCGCAVPTSTLGYGKLQHG